MQLLTYSLLFTFTISTVFCNDEVIHSLQISRWLIDEEIIWYLNISQFPSQVNTNVIAEPQVEALEYEHFPEPNGTVSISIHSLIDQSRSWRASSLHLRCLPRGYGIHSLFPYLYAFVTGFTCKNSKCVVRRLKRGVECPPTMIIGG